MKTPPRVFLLGLLIFGLPGAPAVFAGDKRVVVSANAAPDYTQKKYGDKTPRRETYVFMQGDYHPGGTADRSLEKISFRQIVEWLAPELAKQNYLPVKEIKEADLLIVVSWGTTTPPVESAYAMRAQTNPLTDTSTSATTLSVANGGPSFGEGFFSDANRQLQFDALEQGTDRMSTLYGRANEAQLLGYSYDLRRLGGSMFSTSAEDSLRQDLREERYFIIVKAFDLKSLRNKGPKRSVWTLHVNMGALGRNFDGALKTMGPVAANYFGKATTEVTAVVPKEKSGEVDIGELKVVGDVPQEKK